MTGELAVEVEEPASKAYENKVANKMPSNDFATTNHPLSKSNIKEEGHV